MVHEPNVLTIIVPDTVVLCNETRSRYGRDRGS